MSSIKFFIQTKKSPANIYVRVTTSKSNDIKRKTSYVIDPEQWDRKKGYPKQLGSLHSKLYDLSKKILSEMNNTDEINGDWLLSVIYGKKESFSSMVDAFILDAPNMRNGKGGQGLSVNRIKNLKSFKALILKYKDTSAPNKSWLKGLVEWMRKREYGNNYIAKTVENVKSISRHYGVKNDLYDVKVYWEPVKVVTLSFEELEHIKTLDLVERLVNVRKWLLLGCYTGQRGGDLLSMKESDIKTVQDCRIIELKQQKTGLNVAVPLIPDALEVLDRGFPYYLSLQKFNKYLKELMVLSGIEKNITSHCMRRSFATNYYGKLPTPLIMSVTGHKKEASFLKYIGKSQFDSALEFLSYFGKK